MINEILEKLYTIEHIPSHPLIKDRISKILTNLDLSSDDDLNMLAEFISYDPSLTIELLKISNSGSFGFKDKISSIKHALLILDNDLIKLIVEQHPVLPELETYDKKIDQEFIKILKHSIEVHEIVNILLDSALIERIDDSNIYEELLSASTIHDIGLYFILTFFPDLFFEIMTSIRDTDSPILKSGDTRIPDHSMLGSILCSHWNLPSFMKISVAFHHYPWAEDIDNKKISIGSEVLFIGDSLSTSFYTMYYDEDDVFTINERIIMRRDLLHIMDKHGIDIRELPQIRTETETRIAEIYNKIGLNSPDA